MSNADPKLETSPRLESLLGSLRAHIVRQLILYGFGTIFGAAVLWLGFAFLSDWGLRVPHALRIFHGAILIGVVALFAYRDLIRPWRKIPDRAGLALLLERAHPELQEILISAVQFQATGDRTDRACGDPDLRRRVVAQAEERVGEIAVIDVLDREAPRARFLLGLGGAAGLAALSFLNPLYSKIFFQRLAGADTPWPQRTQLEIELPGLAGAVIEESHEHLHLRVARGTDIPILIRALGVLPEEVTLHFEGGRDRVLSPSGGDFFRTILPSCQETTLFSVTGGDDRDGKPQIEIEVLQPPDVEGLAIVVDPPAYARLDSKLVFDRDVEALAGSRIRIHIQPFPTSAKGVARLLPSDQLIELIEAPFPALPGAADSGVEPAPPAPAGGLFFETIADKSFGYRIELTDDTGLSNPDPGLFRVRVREDRVPEIQVLAPSRTEFEIVRGGAIPLRARVEDDFGIVDMRWSVKPFHPGQETEQITGATFDLIRIDPLAVPSADAKKMELRLHRSLANVRIEVDDLATEAVPLVADQRYVLEISARDNRQPEPGVGYALPIRARVVTPEELLRRMQDRLAQARLEAIRLSDLQGEKRARVEELLDSLEGDETLEAGDSLVLAAALSGQRRVASEAQSLSFDLAAVAEDILYARLDEKAAALLDFYHERTLSQADLRFLVQPWRELAVASAAGNLGAAGFAANLVELVAIALEVSEDYQYQAVQKLNQAERAIEPAAVQTALIEASAIQSRALERLEDLLDKLAEWDNFQNILALTRDIRNRQKALRERTQQFMQEK
ncbi:MAG: hypothetical protein CMJ89_11790 [Planctomycetes bacterium]|jgi:hypothetical protein|nr:hypothetical protein [Planctomycetota bacterium]